MLRRFRPADPLLAALGIDLNEEGNYTIRPDSLASGIVPTGATIISAAMAKQSPSHAGDDFQKIHGICNISVSVPGAQPWQVQVPVYEVHGNLLAQDPRNDAHFVVLAAPVKGGLPVGATLFDYKTKPLTPRVIAALADKKPAELHKVSRLPFSA